MKSRSDSLVLTQSYCTTLWRIQCRARTKGMCRISCQKTSAWSLQISWNKICVVLSLQLILDTLSLQLPMKWVWLSLAAHVTEYAYNQLLCLGTYVQARYTVVCLCVCLSVYRLLYSCSRTITMKSFQGFQSRFLILIRGFTNNANWFSSYAQLCLYLKCHCSLLRKALEKLVHGVLQYTIIINTC